MWYPISVILEESPLNSAVVTEILLCLYKQFVSYDRAKTEKIGDFFALTWLIFAGPVTYNYYCIAGNFRKVKISKKCSDLYFETFIF